MFILNTLFKLNNEMFYFGNFGVLINNKDETDEIGEHDLNENSSLIDEEESVQTTRMQSNSSKVSTDNMTDGIFEQNDDVEDGDDEVEDAMSKETDDDFFPLAHKPIFCFFLFFSDSKYPVMPPPPILFLSISPLSLFTIYTFVVYFLSSPIYYFLSTRYMEGTNNEPIRKYYEYNNTTLQ